MADGQHEAKSSGKLLSDSVYRIVKFCALIAFPAFGAAYFALADIWGLPKAQEVVGTVVVVDTFLGALVGVAKAKYDNSDERFSGSIDLVPDHENETTDLHVSMDPNAVQTSKEITLKVNRPSS